MSRRPRSPRPERRSARGGAQRRLAPHYSFRPVPLSEAAATRTERWVRREINHVPIITAAITLSNRRGPVSCRALTKARRQQPARGRKRTVGWIPLHPGDLSQSTASQCERLCSRMNLQSQLARHTLSDLSPQHTEADRLRTRRRRRGAFNTVTASVINIPLLKRESVPSLLKGGRKEAFHPASFGYLLMVSCVPQPARFQEELLSESSVKSQQAACLSYPAGCASAAAPSAHSDRDGGFTAGGLHMSPGCFTSKPLHL
ncbi:hypothetical protein SKAU_G00252860 [Synaphobranchus kaupii]|uniref:Uncharacterized protein n=1 Tax=Synaphobranchus kaupii TaxID=118154 RepID=A0A9Q1F3E7_SYNKA|nr:hypothetical protein SKAU_G00252860 [Synaphobranchus kaupii]